MTIAKDAKQLIEKVVEARGLDINNVKCRTVIDGGQGSLKIVTSVFQGDIDELTQEGNSEKLTGSNRLIILAEVEGAGDSQQYPSAVGETPAGPAPRSSHGGRSLCYQYLLWYQQSRGQVCLPPVWGRKYHRVW